jgi:arsenate reductase
MNQELFTDIRHIIGSLNTETLSVERKLALQPLVDFIQTKISDQQDVRLNFICTHNSRRSHLAQVWAQAMASYFNTKNVFCYSGGTEATALFPVIVQTLENSGFKVKTISTGTNPIYSIKYTDNEPPIIGFSKTYDDDFNPQSEFAAVMTCSHADEGCPYISGTEQRIPVTFEDPKVFDNTPQQTKKYNERSIQIATELYFVFSQVKS